MRRRVQELEEDLETATTKCQISILKLDKAATTADDSDRMAKVLQNRYNSHYSSLVREADVEISGGAAGFLAWCKVKKITLKRKKFVVLCFQVKSYFSFVTNFLQLYMNTFYKFFLEEMHL
jgi:hypothetical protein